MTQLAMLEIAPASMDAGLTLAPRHVQKYPDIVGGSCVIPASEGL